MLLSHQHLYIMAELKKTPGIWWQIKWLEVWLYVVSCCIVQYKAFGSMHMIFQAATICIIDESKDYFLD